MFMPGGLISGIQKIAEFTAAKMKRKKDSNAQA
jgi:hypothetical protein